VSINTTIDRAELQTLDRLQSTLRFADDSDRQLVESASQCIAGADVEHTRLSERFTAAGLETAPRPVREAALRAIDQINAREKTILDVADQTLEAFATGRRVRRDDGTIVDVPAPTIDAVSEIRAAALWSHLRALGETERNALIRDAIRNDDTELINAIERAPRAMGLLDPMTARQLRDTRIARSGFQAEHQRAHDRAVPLRLFARHARLALGLKD
jgi:hypothetical protein